MLDLSRSVMRLAQGQRAAEMTLARRSGSAQASADGTPDSAASERQEAEVDPNAVAERVYELMRQDLRTSLERRA
jgi:hypothetical protein